MHPLEKKTLKILAQEKLLQDGEKVLAAVSGGPDSMALLHILARLAPLLDITVAAVHVNHGLRPGEAEEDAALAVAEAGRLGLDFFLTDVDVRDLAGRQKLSLEHAARLLRYNFIEKTARRWGAAKIALGHTADDQAEELLLRLVRGTARKGLSGMKTMRQGVFIRPFLRFPKSELLAYLDRYGIPFQHDSSNEQDSFLRNRVRNNLLPYLAERYNPDIRRTLVRTATILQDEEELLENLAQAAYDGVVTLSPGKGPAGPGNASLKAAEPDGPLEISLGLFRRQPRAIQRRILEKCCWAMACEPGSRQIEQLLQLAAADSAAAGFHLADGLRITRKKDCLLFSYPGGRRPLRGSIAGEPGPAIPETAIPGPGTYEFAALQRLLVVEEIGGDALPVPGEVFPVGEFLDAALFAFPLTLRPCRPGDRFYPLGGPGSRKVADFLTDLKIEQRKRTLAPVLCSDDTILALPGRRVDNRFRITEKTTRALRVRWVKNEAIRP
jgi:tRNA(Ile)-lysidine synthase